MKISKKDLETKVNKRLDSALLEVLPVYGFNYTRSKIQKMIENGDVTVNSKPAKTSYKLKQDDEIEIIETNEEIPPLAPENRVLDIIYEDEHFFVINKPKNMLTHPTVKTRTGTLVNALLYYCKKTDATLSDIQGPDRAGIVHRLDKNTSGLIVVAKTNSAHINLQKQIQTKTAKRKYLAVVYGVIEENEGIIDKPLVHYMDKTVKMHTSSSGQAAVTLYRVLERFDGLTLIEAELKTGRTHQIRCHMASINHPVYGDTLYGAKGFKSRINLKTTEQLLMSYYLSLKHPESGKDMEFILDKTHYDDDFKRFFEIIRR